MCLPIEFWLWLITIISALLMSAGLSVLALAGSSEHGARSLMMLPLELQATSPPNFLSRFLLGMLMIGFVSFFGALIMLAIVGPLWAAVIGGTILFIAKFSIQGWWTRNADCRPMKPVLVFSVALFGALAFGVVDFFSNR